MKTYMLFLSALALAGCAGRDNPMSPQASITLSATPSSLAVGQSASLSIRLANCAEAVVLTQSTPGPFMGGRTVNAGSVTVSPSQTTTYVAQACGVTSSTTVTVLLPGTLKFAVSSTSVLLNQSVTLNYQLANCSNLEVVLTPSTNIIDALLARLAMTVNMSLSKLSGNQVQFNAGSTMTPNTHRAYVVASCIGDDSVAVRDSVRVDEVQPAWTGLDSATKQIKFYGDTLKFYGHESACTTPNGVDFRGTLSSSRFEGQPAPAPSAMNSSGCINPNTAFLPIGVVPDSLDAVNGLAMTGYLQSNGPLLSAQYRAGPAKP